MASVFEQFAVRADALRFVLGLAAAGSVVLLLASWSPRLACVALLIMTWGIAPTVVALDEERLATAASPTLRLLSLNLAIDHADTERVLAEVRAADADILCFQEYTLQRGAALAPRLEASYPTRFERPRNDSFGMAVYARVPLEDITRFFLADSRTPQVRMRAKLGDTSIVLYALHLVPIHAGLYDRHRREFVDLLRRLADEKDPAALVGDFNFVTHGALCGALRERGYLDTHALAGVGRGASWPVQLMDVGIPGIRVDHIFVGPGLTCTASSVGSGTGSDHRPISASVALAPR